MIELLVVIAIMAILGSMLVAGLKIVRSAANNSKCSSNQRNIAMAIQAYATDNRGALPYRNINSEWFLQAIGYLEDQYQASPQKHRNDVFHCPFAVVEIQPLWLVSYRISAHYGMNSHIRAAWTGSYWTGAGSPPPSGSYIPQLPIRIASLAPSLILLTENMAWTAPAGVYFEDAVDYAGYGPWPARLHGSMATVAPIIWHAQTINFVCVDGHVERVSGQWDENEMKPRFVTSASVL